MHGALTSSPFSKERAEQLDMVPEPTRRPPLPARCMRQGCVWQARAQVPGQHLEANACMWQAAARVPGRHLEAHACMWQAGAHVPGRHL